MAKLVKCKTQLRPDQMEAIRNASAIRSYTSEENMKRVSEAEIIRRCIDRALAYVVQGKNNC